MTILIIEDYLPQLMLLKRLLQKGKHKIISAMCRNEGIRLMKEEKPDLVITDTQLPILEDSMPENKIGVEIVREAQRMKPHPRVWLVSNGMTDELKAEALRYGAEKAVVKDYLEAYLVAAKIIPQT